MVWDAVSGHFSGWESPWVPNHSSVPVWAPVRSAVSDSVLGRWLEMGLAISRTAPIHRALFASSPLNALRNSNAILTPICSFFYAPRLLWAERMVNRYGGERLPLLRSRSGMPFDFVRDIFSRALRKFR